MRASRAELRTQGGAWAVAVSLAMFAPASWADSSLPASADRWIPFATGAVTHREPNVVVSEVGDEGLRLRVDTAGLELGVRTTKGGEFVKVGWRQAAMAGRVGEPALPVVRRLFIAPRGATVTLHVEKGRESPVNLNALGLSQPVVPVQPPVPMIPGLLEQTPFYHDQAAYAADEPAPSTRAAATELGVWRGHRLFWLEVRPVAYSAVRGVLAVYPRIDVAIRFEGEGRGAGTSGADGAADRGPLPALSNVLLNPAGPSASTDRGSGHFLVVAAAAFADDPAMLDFTTAKAAEGYQVMTYAVPPGATKEAIKSYIESLWHTPDTPDYLLLVGDVDTIPEWTGQGNRSATTDLPYACMDGAGDWYPDVAIGRFSVNTAAQLRDVVDKTLLIEAGHFPDPDYTRRAVFMSGYDTASGDEATHNWVIDTYLADAGFTSDKLYQRTYGATTQDVYDSFNAGVLYGAFYGHAAPGPTGNRIWQNGPPFYHNDVYALNDGAICTLLLHMTCNVGKYYLWDECFTEAWLRAPNRGAAVNIGASEFIYSVGHGGENGWPETSDLEKFVFDSIYLDGIREAGPLWQAALMRLLAKYGPTHPPSRDYFEMFNLMGDPSLRVPEPALNYLIVAPTDFAASAPLNQFAEAKAAKGFNVSVQTVRPGTSRANIKADIESLWTKPDAPDYILIVGDTNGDPSTTNTIPHWVGQGSRAAVTDLPYACMDGANDWYPDVFIGRFPVRTTTQLQTVVDKTLLVESGVFSDPDYIKRAVFLASDDMDTDSEANHDWIINNYLTPAGYDSAKVYARLGGNTQDIADAVNAGTLFTVYMGHSTSNGWWAPSFDQNDVNALANDGLYGLAVGWSCNTAYFEAGECFGETWLREPGKGAAAYLSASDYVWWGSYEEWESSRRMERYLFQSFFVDGIWEVGPAWQAALYRLLADPDFGPGHDHTRNIFEEFVLLGDPSLRLPQHQAGFTLAATPTSQTVCCPPDEEARYLVQVGLVGGPDATVKLSASGAPEGATIGFAADEHRPPFATVLTVGNLAGVGPGRYALEIAGVASDMIRTTDVDLHVADSPPQTVVLTVPPNGASGISRQPALAWRSSGQAAAYHAVIATDAAFTHVVLTADVNGPSLTVETPLDPLTTYYWHVRATNGCGTTAYSATFTFTTVDQVDYFTEQFVNDCDVDGLTVHFVPDGSNDAYYRCASPITELPTDPAGGQTLSIGEDGYATVTLTGGLRVNLYGVSYTTFYVGDNGYITFTRGDTVWEESLAQHFGIPRVSALFDDLSVPQGGSISRKQTADRIAITWTDVPEWNTGNANTFQVEMFFTGEIHVSWLGIDAYDGIVGLSEGAGIPEDPFPESDMSAGPTCDQQPGFTLDIEPDTQGVCAPDAALFTIDVGQALGFTETVTLTTSGEPPSATVHFSANNLAPPFTAMMTIGNTGSVAPADYPIEVIGTAPSLVRSEEVTLHVATVIPPAVSLTDPPDAATDVPVTPTLQWQPAPQAAEYRVDVAADPAFAAVVFTATVHDPAAMLDSTLDERTTYHWRVRASNGCGAGDDSTPFRFTTMGTLHPIAYDMLNGETGTYSYFDDGYDGSGDHTLPLAPLSGGLGELTDGVVADQPWNVTPGPYVGWRSVDPTITFHFDGVVAVSALTLHLDDGGAGGGVNPPVDVTIVMDGETRPCAVTDPPGNGPFALTCDDVDLTGDTLELTLADFNAQNYVMLSEVEFRGEPRTGACCIDETCSRLTEEECTTGGGEYGGHGTGCDPNPCATYDPGCLIISEVVYGVDSGGCPRWIEITNTALIDFTFLEGGLIVQMDDSHDVQLDVDLSGVTIPAGTSFVINSNQSGACTGAFPIIYGFDADRYTETPFGDGNDRYLLTNTADGSNILDIYGEFGINGTGRPWEYTESYAYRRSSDNAGRGPVFAPQVWFFGGVGALAGGGNPTQLLLELTTPGTHAFDESCSTLGLPGDFDGDGDVDADDYARFETCFTGPDGGPIPSECDPGDADRDDDVDCDDWRSFTVAWTAGGLPPIHPECPCLTADPPLPDSPLVAKNRYVSFTPLNPGGLTALRLTFSALPAPFDIVNGQAMWIGPPEVRCENAGQTVPPPEGCAAAPGSPTRSFLAATLQCEPYYVEWGTIEAIHVHDEYIVPGGAYALRAITYGCDTAIQDDYSAPLTLTTSVWGDLVKNCTVIPCLPPDGQVDVTTDVTAVLDKFKNLAGAPAKTRSDVEPAVVDLRVNITDITYVLDAFRGFAYPFDPGPAPPPCP